jgi:hypothetical protein
VYKLDVGDSLDGIQSVQGVANPPQIRTRSWINRRNRLAGTYQFSQGVASSIMNRSSEIQFGYRQNVFKCNFPCIKSAEKILSLCRHMKELKDDTVI